MNPIEATATSLLSKMVDKGGDQFPNNWFAQETQYSPNDINDSLEYLEDIGAVKLIRTFGTAPYSFNTVWLQSRGRYLYHELKEKQEESKENVVSLPQRPLNPIGSPYGFTEYDWETVALQREDNKKLYVVLGHKFESKHFNTSLLIKNIRDHLQKSIEEYNQRKNETISLNFETLGAGYGEHLFNEIARNIIGSDIAIFETSDLNPNVMIELGVALTWGVRVLPIHEVSCPKPPSDISGQTWIAYENSAEKMIDSEFERRLVKMIERVILLKGR